MLHEGLRERFIVIKRHRFIQNRDVAGLTDISADCRDEPERIVVKAAADIGVAFLGERLVLMIGAAVRELGRIDIDDPLSCALRHQVHETEQILAGISEAHASAYAGLIIGSASGHIEGDHALVLIPDIDHSVHFGAGALHMEFREQLSPVGAKRLVGCNDIAAFVVLADHGARGSLIDHAIGFPFVFYGILNIGELEDHARALSGSKCDVEFIYSAGRPAAGYSILTGAVLDHFGKGRASVVADKGAPVCVESVDRAVYREDSVHIAALSVLSAVINSSVIEFAVICDRSGSGFLQSADLVTEIGLYFDLACRKVSLEIFLVIIRVPEAPLYIRKYFEVLDLL